MGATTRFAAFLATELAPTPGRGRATMRLVVACVVSTAIVMAFHIPEGHWAIITIFTVGQPDAGASLRKGVERMIGTVIGGLVGIFVVSAFADEPAIRLVLLGVLGTAGLFLSRTTTAPYVGLLAGFTAMIVIANVEGREVGRAVEIGLLRIVLIAFGVAIGTGAQLFLWPTDPERALLDELTARLDAVCRAVRRCLEGSPSAAVPRASTLAQSGLARHLDLLANAEARHPGLRRRHVEQLTLIGAVERLLTGALAVERAASSIGTAGRPPAVTARRLWEILASCERLRDAIGRHAPVAARASVARTMDDAVAAEGAARVLPALVDMERALDDAAGATRSWEAGTAIDVSADRPVAPTAERSPLDEGPGGFFTPAFSASNTGDLAFAMKGGLAASACYALVNGMAWPGLQTSIWTCLLVAQSTFGATAQKEMLRLAGAVLGGLLGLLTIVVAMPNLETLAPFLVVVAAGSAVAAWITCGSARISYAGIQTGFAFGICIVDVPGTVVSLVPGRDRVLGILLGIVVTGFVFRVLGHARANAQLRGATAATLRALAGLARVGIVPSDTEVRPARGYRWTVYQCMATTLRLHDEAQFEAGAGHPEMIAVRDAVLRLTSDAQAVFLAMLDLVRHRLNVDLGPLAEPTRPTRRALAVGIADSLAGVADRIDGRAVGPTPDLRDLLARAEAAAADGASAHLRARLLLYRDLVSPVLLLREDAAALPPARAG